MSRYDIVVVGGGPAGLAAAVTAAQQDARVLLLESEDRLGGSAALAAGVIIAGGTSVQAALDVEDTPASFFHYYMTLNQWQLQPGLIWAFCQEAAPTLEWLMGLGLRIPAQHSPNALTPGLYRAGVEDVARGHVPVDGGYAIVAALERAQRECGVEAVLHTRVDRLLRDGETVTGVVADGVEVDAGAVVVTTGGFGHNPDLVAEYYPEALAAGDGLFAVSAPGSRGDHIGFGEQAGAALAGHGYGLLLISAYFQRQHYSIAGSPPASRLYVNESGLRFIDEDASYAVAAGIFRLHGGFAWAIFDERGRRSLDPTSAEWTPDRVTEEADGGRTHRANSLEELAGAIGVPPLALRAQVERWNGHFPQGRDPDFHRHVSLAEHGQATALDPIERPPFYAVRMVAGELVTTHTGLRIDDRARVLTPEGRVIPGLYAAGEAGGGVLGERYVGGGNAIANALTMGRIAGRATAGGPSPAQDRSS